jgi:biopolymer transport protein ExbD
MRRFAKSPWIAICLLACCSGCLQKAADQVVSEVQRIVTRPAVDRPIQIAVDGMDSCRIDEGQPVPLAGLQAAMQERTRQIKQADSEPAQFTIRISVDDAAPYSNFAQVVEACQESGFFQFEVVVAELLFPFNLSPLGQELEAETVPQQPPGGEANQRDDESLPSFLFEDARLDSPTTASADGKQDNAALIVPDPAVDAALQWLVTHQAPDGRWNFEHRAGACRGRCDGAGEATAAMNAATSLALLPFLAVGQTHQRGKYQLNVLRGVAYLVKNAKQQANAASFLEPQGTMYSHGLATMALCEAYRQTKDEQLALVCQAALDYIGYAQDPVGGGWRYAPRQPGDTSVTGWQIAALKSGQAAGLDVAANTLSGASRFLDSVQSEDGTNYGYTTPGVGRSTSAIGLNSRIHLGWKSDHEVWRRGAAKLAKIGPSADDMYFNYHATQVLSRHGGEPWMTWQASIRKALLKSQASTGHETGSWHLGRGHGSARGGRLYNTSLAALILETHHRNLGIFQIDESENETSEDVN